MQIHVRARRIQVTPRLFNDVVRRVRSVLGRFAPRIERVVVRLVDVNGPRGGVDKQCRILIAGMRSWVVMVEGTDRNLYTAVDRATERADRVVRRALDRTMGQVNVGNHGEMIRNESPAI